MSFVATSAATKSGPPTGAYIIRNRKHEGVLNVITRANAAVTKEVSLFERNEKEYPEQQIWWVELIPECEGPKGRAYSITNTSSGVSLGCEREHKLGASPSSGELWQRWKLRETDRDHSGERVYYSIMDYNEARSLDGDNISRGNSASTWASIATDTAQHWEFLEPNIKFPHGWFEIANAETGDILNHTYLTSPPRLIYPPKKDKDCKLPMYRERWGTQWATSMCGQDGSEDSEDSWVIRNRLTGGRLGLSSSLGVIAGKTGTLVSAQERWILEFQGGETFWRVRNGGNSCYLKQVKDTLEGDSWVVCTDKKCSRWPMDKDKKWLFRTVYDH